MINYPEPDARYYKRGAIWELESGKWVAIDGAHHSDQHGWKLHHGKGGYYAANARPVMLLTGDPQADYEELCRVFGDKLAVDEPSGSFWVVDTAIVRWIPGRIWLQSWCVSIAGHGTPPELRKWEHNIDCVQATLDELRALDKFNADLSEGLKRADSAIKAMDKELKRKQREFDAKRPRFGKERT